MSSISLPVFLVQISFDNMRSTPNFNCLEQVLSTMRVLRPFILLYFMGSDLSKKYVVINLIRGEIWKCARARSFRVFIFHIFHFHLAHDARSSIMSIAQWISSTFTAMHFTLFVGLSLFNRSLYKVAWSVIPTESKSEPKIWIILSMDVVTSTESIFEGTAEQYKTECTRLCRVGRRSPVKNESPPPVVIGWINWIGPRKC